MSRRTVTVWLLASAAVSLACGGGSSRVAYLREENARLRARLQVLDESARTGQAYADQLEGKPGAPPATLVYTAKDIEALAAKVLPYKMPARQFNSQLAGEFHVEGLTDIKLHAGNRITCRVHYRGVGIRFLGSVPKAYQAQVKRFVDGVKSGVVSELDVELSTSGNLLIARAKATGTALKKNRDRNNEARLTNELNTRVFRKALPIDAAIAGTGHEVFGVTTTQSHVAVVYR